MNNGLARANANLSGQVSLVTGGSRGLGRAFVWALAAAGATVVVTARSEGDLAEEEESAGCHHAVGTRSAYKSGSDAQTRTPGHSGNHEVTRNSPPNSSARSRIAESPPFRRW